MFWWKFPRGYLSESVTNIPPGTPSPPARRDGQATASGNAGEACGCPGNGLIGQDMESLRPTHFNTRH